ncbi:BlaI/MecI/CopY family transcriptional regulator [Massilia violaceinigra]|uniref:BlaI/MecI/CopY family transcriptional regulator n=1 Tax=Massilia violaceinigra TaxID=2045208 RepID=A0A2D2DHE8_9BURK|nr:BlaI/MecI/CopY family transcriptional regulator [Massilia violaceinigra]ATQ74365.1 BlaI/MecI/CopY family transcriptional regulator [Massilia violaceinigra]
MEQQAGAISDAESKVMEVLWQAGRAMPAEDIVAALVNGHQWQEATIKSLLNRLLNKGAVSAQKEGRRYLYTAVLKREHWLTSESKGMLDRLFGGRIAPLVAHFGKHRKLSKTDIAELKRLIGELDDDQ